MRTNLSKFNPDCFLAYEGYEQGIGFICEGIIRNVNSFWTSLAFCLYMFTLLGTLSHFISKYFLRMDNYTYDGSEVESLTSTSDLSSSPEKSQEVRPESEQIERVEQDVVEGGDKTEFEHTTGMDIKKSASYEDTDEIRRSEKGPKWRRGRRKSQIGNIPASTLQRLELGDIPEDPAPEMPHVMTASNMSISSTSNFRPK